MPRCPIVIPEVVRVPLAEGDFVDLKKSLTAGEYREMLGNQFIQNQQGNMTVDFKNFGFVRILAYVVGWSFVGLDGGPLAVSADTVNSMDQATFSELLAAVETHHDAAEAAMTARKNAQGTPIASATI